MVNQEALGLFPALDCRGWYARATPHPDPGAFVPTYEALNFALDLNALIYSGFVMALFEPNIAVNKFGHILSLQDSDAQCIKHAVSRVLDLPYAPFWNVDTEWTCQSQFRAFIQSRARGTVLPFYVYAAYRGAKLEQVTGGYEVLPDALYELGELAMELPMWDEGAAWGNRSFAKSVMKLAEDHCQWPEWPDEDLYDVDLDEDTRWRGVSTSLGLAVCLLVAVMTVLLIRTWPRPARRRDHPPI
ncbi:hypothetical protein OE88DRAFT_370355 [Heliocybe sulcata]|uniref:Uncharacterized protein n=1 Tax=Heliocybe sulcata TaxID=5364 RepID=A0A5C3N0Y9_9AGAM|nr:hypothetical protein OE88DRAFT_370355 [Heliocybe sulcata]